MLCLRNAFESLYDGGSDMGGMTHEMTEEELWLEDVWDKLQTGVYVECGGNVYDRNSSEFICSMSLLKT